MKYNKKKLRSSKVIEKANEQIRRSEIARTKNTTSRLEELEKAVDEVLQSDSINYNITTTSSTPMYSINPSTGNITDNSGNIVYIGTPPTITTTTYGGYGSYGIDPYSEELAQLGQLMVSLANSSEHFAYIKKRNKTKILVE